MAPFLKISVILGFLVVLQCLTQEIEEETPNVSGFHSSQNSLQGNSIFYSIQTDVVAFKNPLYLKCYLRKGENGLKNFRSYTEDESWINALEILFASEQLSQEKVLYVGGPEIFEFCNGYVTYFLHNYPVSSEIDPLNYFLHEKEIQQIHRRPKRSNTGGLLGRVHGQTQSQYLSFGNQPGKAEAEAAYGSSKAAVSGSNGIGSAQSQSRPFGCDGCYGEDSQVQALYYGRRPGKVSAEAEGARPEQILRPGQVYPISPQGQAISRGYEIPGQQPTGPAIQPSQVPPVSPDRMGVYYPSVQQPLQPQLPIQMHKPQVPQVSYGPEAALRPGEKVPYGPEAALRPGEKVPQVPYGPEAALRPGERVPQVPYGPEAALRPGEKVPQVPYGPEAALRPGERVPQVPYGSEAALRPGEKVPQVPYGPEAALRPGEKLPEVMYRPEAALGPGEKVSQVLYGPEAALRPGEKVPQVPYGPEATLRPGERVPQPSYTPQIPAAALRPGEGPYRPETVLRPGEAIPQGPYGPLVQTLRPGEQLPTIQQPSVPATGIKPPTSFGPITPQIQGKPEGLTPEQIAVLTGAEGWQGQRGQFTGELAGRYQPYGGQRGRFHGVFSGEYDANGKPLSYTYPTQQIPAYYLQPQRGIGGGQTATTGQTVVPGGQAVIPGGQAYIPGGQAVPPGGQTVISGGQTVVPGGQTVLPGGQTVLPGGQGILPGGQVAVSGGQAVAPGGQAVAPGGQVAVPGGQSIFPGGQAAVPGGQVVLPGGQTVYPGGQAGVSGGPIGMGEGQAGVVVGQVHPAQPGTVSPQLGGGQAGAGYPGMSGQLGYPGTSGQVGYPGTSGQVGYPGTSGQAGYPGTSAQVGYPGTSGQVGYPGTSGQAVYPGTSGQVGYPGTSGQVGYPVISGQVGYPGTAHQVGYPGTAGQVGYPGVTGQGTRPAYTITSQVLQPGGGQGGGYSEGIQEVPSELSLPVTTDTLDKDADSQAQAEVQHTNGTTEAKAQAQGYYANGAAQSQVSGTYSGSGSFSALAGSLDGKRGAQTQVEGGKEGATSSAHGIGGAGSSQAQVQLLSETGDTMSNAQSSGLYHGSNTQVQASSKGGMADAQANGPGSTSSQAQIGFTPHEEAEDEEDRNETTPFKGGGMASAQSGNYAGQTQSQLQGKFRYGIRYAGAAQAGSGSKDAVESSRNQSRPMGLSGLFPTFRPFTFSSGSSTNNVQVQNHVEKQMFEENRINEEKAMQRKTYSVQQKSKTLTTTTTTTTTTTAAPKSEDYNEGDYGEEYDDEEEIENNSNSNTIISQNSRTQRQNIFLDPLEDLDATVTQAKGDPDLPVGTVLQPGQSIPGSNGYKIPLGFRGRVASVANDTDAIAVGHNSQAQTVSLKPGTGKVIYKKPVYAVGFNTRLKNGERYGFGTGYTYQPITYQLRSGKSPPNFVSITKSESGSKDIKTGERNPSLFYTQSSTCGFFTNTCVFSGSRKICIPKPKMNPDGSPVIC